MKQNALKNASNKNINQEEIAKKTPGRKIKDDPDVSKR